ncbi:small acid-soluble spore protein P [Paenibacillus sp. GSMTC-2017]|uniref:small acid-soluble spore protein P n=1 Tax=Paenibacillus sp. GSMTC-2017 TaxID=2794350 RepID=UPI0018D658C6|nr:small acid-soluble spore protein P [Paenibacillus sp. GSMTC-2017]MBH5320499.1 small acid-soluble spore protein P [Paenibacillus sp. GSMTC-2017]
MGKPDSVPVPDSVPHNQKSKQRNNEGQQEPLSGSKKTKNKNHVDHHNPQG